jgi:hypothetical protein
VLFRRNPAPAMTIDEAEFVYRVQMSGRVLRLSRKSGSPARLASSGFVSTRPAKHSGNTIVRGVLNGGRAGSD